MYKLKSGNTISNIGVSLGIEKTITTKKTVNAYIFIQYEILCNSNFLQFTFQIYFYFCSVD
jgi:hypothetical protein